MEPTDTPTVGTIALLALFACVSTGLIGVALGRASQVLLRWYAERKHPADIAMLRRWGMEQEALGDPVNWDWVDKLIGLPTGLLISSLVVLLNVTVFYVFATFVGLPAATVGAAVLVGILAAPTLLVCSRCDRLCRESATLSDPFPQPIGDVRLQRVVVAYRWAGRQELREEFEFAVRSRRLTALEAVQEFGGGTPSQHWWAWFTRSPQRNVLGFLAAIISSIIGFVVIHMTGLDALIPGGHFFQP